MDRKQLTPNCDMVKPEQADAQSKCYQSAIEEGKSTDGSTLNHLP